MNGLDSLTRDYKYSYEIKDGIGKLQKGIRNILFCKSINPDNLLEVTIKNINFDIVYGIIKSDKTITIISKKDNNIICIYGYNFYVLTIEDDKIIVHMIDSNMINYITYE